jgi:hypothetical protein
MPSGADALSDVLKTVRLTGATFFDVVASAPWVAEQPPRDMILAKILPGAGHLIAYQAGRPAVGSQGSPWQQPEMPIVIDFYVIQPTF